MTTDAEREKAFEETVKTALEALGEFLAGKGSLEIRPNDAGWIIRLVRAPKS
jgi:hypothetical protein